MSRFRVRDLYPELPFRLRVMVLGRLIEWAKEYCSPPTNVDVFARILAREGLLRVARDLLWQDVAVEYALRNSGAEFPWPAPEGKPVNPNSRAELTRLVADLAAELPPELVERSPELAELPAMLVEHIAAWEFGEGAPPEAYIEWMYAAGHSPSTVHLLLSDLIAEFLAYREEQAALAGAQAGVEVAPGGWAA